VRPARARKKANFLLNEGACLFEREHHCRIAAVLEALDAERLLANECLFGGGTAMALRYGE
jgi:hypothetical protein